MVIEIISLVKRPESLNSLLEELDFDNDSRNKLKWYHNMASITEEPANNGELYHQLKIMCHRSDEEGLGEFEKLTRELRKSIQLRYGDSIIKE
jgi:hypothetical protein